jgi:hypothetical protein
VFVGVCLDKSEFACSYPMSNRAALGHLGRHDSRPTQHPASTRGAQASRLDGTRAPLSKPAEHGPALPCAARSTAGARKGARHCCPCSTAQRLPPGRGAVRRGQHPQRIVSQPPPDALGSPYRFELGGSSPPTSWRREFCLQARSVGHWATGSVSPMQGPHEAQNPPRVQEGHQL